MKQKDFLAYVRINRPDAEENFTLQYCELLAFAENNEITIANHLDEVRSGADTNFRMLCDYFRNAKKINNLLVYSFDRISRNYYENFKLAKELRDKYGVIIVSVQQPDIDILNVKPWDQLKKVSQ